MAGLSSTRIEPGDTSSVACLSFASGNCVLLSTPAPYKIDDKSAQNEDSYLAIELNNSTVLAVADGVGGYPGGKEASMLAITMLENALKAATATDNSYRNAILDSIEACNAKLLELGHGATTTITVVEVSDSTMRPYHVGDSSIMVVGQRGLQKFQTISHSPIGFGIEAGLLEPDIAHQHDERHWVSNLVGTQEMRIEVGAPLQMASFDTLLLCSDGLTDNMSQLDIGEIIRKGPLDVSLQQLKNSCSLYMQSESGQPDDLTVILYRGC